MRSPILTALRRGFHFTQPRGGGVVANSVPAADQDDGGVEKAIGAGDGPKLASVA